MKKFVCPVCGYVHEAAEMPADFKCPLCKVPGSKFKILEQGKLAAEHEYGVYAKSVKNNPDISEEDKKFIFDQLMANFNGECAEVGTWATAFIKSKSGDASTRQATSLPANDGNLSQVLPLTVFLRASEIHSLTSTRARPP